MGENGLLLHHWIFNGKTEEDMAMLNDSVQSSGAVIVGGRTYHIAIDNAWGGTSPFSSPAFVVTHQKGKPVEGFTFIDSVEEAYRKAMEVAAGKNVWLMGGANIMQQFLKARLVNEIKMHIAPVLLFNGTRLFENLGEKKILLEKIEVKDTLAATHLRYKVLK